MRYGYISHKTAFSMPINLSKKIIIKCQLLVENPKIGRKRAELSKDIYSFLIDRYCIFYSPINDSGVIIQRVINSSRDIANIDFH